MVAPGVVTYYNNKSININPIWVKCVETKYVYYLKQMYLAYNCPTHNWHVQSQTKVKKLLAMLPTWSPY